MVKTLTSKYVNSRVTMLRNIVFKSNVVFILKMDIYFCGKMTILINFLPSKLSAELPFQFRCLRRMLKVNGWAKCSVRGDNCHCMTALTWAPEGVWKVDTQNEHGG